MNLRGTIIPVVDLRSKFGMTEAGYNQFTVLIVVTVGAKIMGLVEEELAALGSANEAPARRPRVKYPETFRREA